MSSGVIATRILSMYMYDGRPPSAAVFVTIDQLDYVTKLNP